MSEMEIIGIEAIGGVDEIFEEMERWVVGIGGEIEGVVEHSGGMIGIWFGEEEIRGEEVGGLIERLGVKEFGKLRNMIVGIVVGGGGGGGGVLESRIGVIVYAQIAHDGFPVKVLESAFIPVQRMAVVVTIVSGGEGVIWRHGAGAAAEIEDGGGFVTGGGGGGGGGGGAEGGGGWGGVELRIWGRSRGGGFG